jgi:hypothetical protein
MSSTGFTICIGSVAGISARRLFGRQSHHSARLLSSSARGVKGVGGILEIRTYEAHPGSSVDYLGKANAIAPVRSEHLGENWKLFLQADTGAPMLLQSLTVQYRPVCACVTYVCVSTAIRPSAALLSCPHNVVLAVGGAVSTIFL